MEGRTCKYPADLRSVKFQSTDAAGQSHAVLCFVLLLWTMDNMVEILLRSIRELIKSLSLVCCSCCWHFCRLFFEYGPEVSRAKHYIGTTTPSLLLLYVLTSEFAKATDVFQKLKVGQGFELGDFVTLMMCGSLTKHFGQTL